MKNRSIRVVFCISLLAGMVACADTGANYRPVVDLKGVNGSKYEQDLSECQSLARQTSNAGTTAGEEAVAGTAIGGLLGLVGGGNGSNIAQAAGVGAVIGGAHGLYSGSQSQETVIKRCLSGRGYKVLQ